MVKYDIESFDEYDCVRSHTGHIIIRPRHVYRGFAPTKLRIYGTTTWVNYKLLEYFFVDDNEFARYEPDLNQGLVLLGPEAGANIMNTLVELKFRKI